MAPQQPNPYFDQAAMDYIINRQMPPTPTYYDGEFIDDRGGWMTDINKGSNLTTDLDYLISNNLLAPGAFDPVTTMEEVEAPGYVALERMRNGSDWEKWIADQFDANVDPGQIEAMLQQKLTDPQDDIDEALARSVPRAIVDGKLLEDPDLYFVRETIQGLGEVLASDPAYELVDGKPMASTTSDSAAALAAQEAGYVSDPTATYDPWSFAPQGVTPEGDQKIYDEMAQAMQRAALSDQAYEDIRGGPSLQANAGRLTDEVIQAMQNEAAGAPNGGTGAPAADSTEWFARSGDMDTFLGGMKDLDVEEALRGMPGGLNVAELGRRRSGQSELTQSIPRAEDFPAINPNTLMFEGGPTRGRVGQGTWTPDNNTPPPTTPLSEGGPTAARLNDPDLGAAGFSSGGRPTSDALADLLNPPLPKVTPPPIPMGLGAQAQEKLRGQARKQKAVDRRAAQNASGFNTQAAYARMLRDNFVRELQAQGYSPLGDEIAGRNQAVYGFPVQQQAPQQPQQSTRRFAR